MSLISATCCKKFNSMNILQHRPSDFVAEPVPGYTCNILVLQPLQHQKEVLCCQCKYKCPTCSLGLSIATKDENFLTPSGINIVGTLNEASYIILINFLKSFSFLVLVYTDAFSKQFVFILLRFQIDLLGRKYECFHISV